MRNYALVGMLMFSVLISGCKDLSEVRRDRLKKTHLGDNYRQRVIREGEDRGEGLEQYIKGFEESKQEDFSRDDR